MPELPTGTVTFLFTDIEGSSRLLQELGPTAYGAALAEHRRLLRAAFAEFGGAEVDTQGDAFFVAFSTAPAAVAAAREAQRTLDGGPLRVRMGLHTGTPERSGDGYVGVDVHLAARIAAAGHGGQVLLSAQARALLDSDANVLDLGEHRLKDFSGSVRVYQLGREAFPPLKTIASTNLPRLLSEFIGREREVAELARVVADGARLVTLTGPGGTGKTRLAIEAAAELVPRYEGGTFWVDLSTVRDPGLVGGAIGHVLGARGDVAEHVGQRQLLIVLDNLEQVVEAAPDLARLLVVCPNLQLLATSRERLRVRGETEYAVPPLESDDAIELFQRRSGIAADDAARELCRRLDNLPLAVELAAARTSVLSARQLLERLGARLDLLKSGRDADPRQQTLRTTIEWSYDLLETGEQTLFARLAVFGGSFALEAAEAVTDADLDTLQALVDKSLLRHEGERFAMLETIRAYATERLAASGEAAELGRRHARFYAALVSQAEPVLWGRGAEGWLDRLESELGNLRASIEWLLDAGETQLALDMTGALWSFWNRRGHLVEGMSRLVAALDADPRPTPARGKALNAASELSGWTGQHELGRQLAAEALSLHRSLGDDRAAGWSAWALGMAMADEGSFDEARDMLEQCITALGAAGAEEERLVAIRSLAWVLEELGDRRRARTLSEEGLVDARVAGSEEMESTFLGVLATTYAEDEGRVADALSMLERSIQLMSVLGDRLALMVDLSRIARVLSIAGRMSAAAQILSRADALREEMGVAFEPWNVKLNAKTLEVIRAGLDEEEFLEAWAIGRRLSVAEAVDLGLTGEPEPAP